ncbi:hypothetical protein R50072_12180 [Simiduia litorea]|uniref:hypothetical protein n=1 Tax=Simiduia litorea TaxID=1435348 RepID=UPI0036F3749B
MIDELTNGLTAINNFLYTLSPEAYIAIIALLGSWASLLHVRRNDRLSVLPLLNLEVYADPISNEVCLNLYNSGLGPARIKKLCFYQSNLPILKNFEDSVNHIIKNCFPKNKFTYNGHGMVGLCSGAVIRENSMTEIIGLKIHRANGKAIELSEAYEILENIHLRVLYEDFYGKEFFYDSEAEQECYLSPNEPINQPKGSKRISTPSTIKIRADEA